MSRKKLIWNGLFAAALALAIFLLYRIFRQYNPGDILRSFRNIPVSGLAFAMGAAACSYLCLTGFDVLAIRSLGKRLPYRRIALASFISLSLGHNIGFAGLSSGAFRYRFYSRWGLSTEDVAKIILFCGVTVGLGLITLGALALIADPQDAAALLELGESAARVVGFLLLLVPLAYVIAAAKLRGRVNLWRWSLQMPSWRIALGQVVIGTVNFCFVSACLHALLSTAAPVDFFRSVTAFVLANSATLATHVPGGLGVLEATVTHVVPNAASIGVLIAFRGVYFLIPLILGTSLLVITEFVFRSASSRKQHAAEAARQCSETTSA